MYAPGVMDPDNDFLPYITSHYKDRRSKRVKGYYVCGHCSIQIIKGIPKPAIDCPICNRELVLCSKVDEWMVHCIESWSNNNLITN